MPTVHISKDLEKIIIDRASGAGEGANEKLGAKAERFGRHYLQLEEEITRLRKENEIMRSEIIKRLETIGTGAPPYTSTTFTPQTQTIVDYVRIERIVKNAVESAMAR